MFPSHKRQFKFISPKRPDVKFIDSQTQKYYSISVATIKQLLDLIVCFKQWMILYTFGLIN